MSEVQGRSAAEIARRKAEIVAAHGPWTAHDIHLGHGVYTTDFDWHGIHPRTAKIIRAIHDLVGPDMSRHRVLDLGCLEGLLAVEAALYGCHSVGVEVRDDSLAKANFAKEMLGLDRLRFVKGDATRLDELDLPELRDGGFDAVLCCGLFYHFDAPDLLPFLRAMHRTTRRLLVLDTHVAFEATERFSSGGRSYEGYSIREHPADTTEERRAKALWASHMNDHSFIPTLPSLLNMLHDAGFDTVLESHFPRHAHLTQDRVILFALKTAPFAVRNWPDHPEWPDFRIDEPDPRPRLTQWPDFGPVANRHTLLVPPPPAPPPEPPPAPPAAPVPPEVPGIAGMQAALARIEARQAQQGEVLSLLDRALQRALGLWMRLPGRRR
ncbi:class I SAM-dependent methyltransferase [Falsiroseomonas sp. CW058]|uniref:class I SAM-dependent methyltransferase n=1 Tax=Falsiroseomonas sp. CW058 TaxID=3388664 RepID=UPI003D3223E8